MIGYFLVNDGHVGLLVYDGPCGLSVKALGYGLDDPSSIPGAEDGDFFLLRVQIGPRTHLASCKMITGAFLGIKSAERMGSHPTSS